MNTKPHIYKLNNQSGYPFLSIALEKNEIGLSIKSFTGATLGVLSIMAYSPCFRDNFKLLLKDNMLIVQVGVDHVMNTPFKMHLLDKESRYVLNSDLVAIKSAEIKLDNNFLYEVNGYNLVNRNALQIDLSYRPNYFKHYN